MKKVWLSCGTFNATKCPCDVIISQSWCARSVFCAVWTLVVHSGLRSRISGTIAQFMYIAIAVILLAQLEPFSSRLFLYADAAAIAMPYDGETCALCHVECVAQILGRGHKMG